MNCEQFEDRLNEMLDQRESVENDSQLRRHANECFRCDQMIRLWSSIEQSVPESELNGIVTPTSKPPSRRAHAVGAAIAIAASALLIVGPRFIRPENFVAEFDRDETAAIATTDLPPDSQSLNSVIAETNPSIMVENDPTKVTAWQLVDPWWNFVEEESLVVGTMPAIDSVRAGVEPLGRSMKRAIAILINHSIVPPETVPPQQTPTDFTEQTSMERIATQSRIV